MPSKTFPSRQRMYVPYHVLSASLLIYLAKRKPVDISAPAPAATTPPKRRRIPITVVEPDAALSSTTSIVKPSSASDMGLMTAVSSRPLSKSSSSASPVSQLPTKSASVAFATPDASISSKPPPQTFREAKAAREELKPRGGIFRSDGGSSLFYSSSPSTANANAPKRETPETLVAFTRIWNELTTEEERWDVLRVSNVTVATDHPTDNGMPSKFLQRGYPYYSKRL